MTSSSIVVKNDVDAMLKKIAYIFDEKNKKPTIVFIGDSGVGKSSIIKKLFLLAGDESAAKEVLIGNKGEAGTTSTTLVSGTYINCLDLEGRCIHNPDKETTKQFIERLQRCIKKYDVEFYMLVLNAADERWKDNDKYYFGVMKEIMTNPKPFIVLINRIDMCHNLSEMKNERSYHIKTEFSNYKLPENLVTYYTGLTHLPLSKNTYFQGVFQVASSPQVTLTRKCPNEEETKPEEWEPQTAHIVTTPEEKFKELDIPVGQMVICLTCKKYFIVEDFENNEIFKDKILPKLPRGFCEDEHHRKYAKAINLGTEDEPMMRILSSSSEYLSTSVIKQIFTDILQKAKACSITITKIVCGVTKSTQAIVDEHLCSKIANTFDFPNSGAIHKSFEKNRWAPYQPQFYDIFHFLFEEKDLENYLIAWGIYYVIKYSGARNVVVGTPQNQLEKCEQYIKALKRNGDVNLVRSIYSKVVSSRADAFSIYLYDVSRYWPKIEWVNEQ